VRVSTTPSELSHPPLQKGGVVVYYGTSKGCVNAAPAHAKTWTSGKMSNFIRSLSQRLFWDVDPETIDEHAHCRYIIQRVLERGSLEDIRATVAHYTMPFMIAEAQQIRSLDPVTLAFAACLGNVKEETFRCYSSTR